MLLFNNFDDTIFVKESTDLESRYNALSKLIDENPNNDDIKQALYIVKKGLDGEKEIAYQLKKSNLGLYVLHDINIEYEDMKAQIDYIVISKAYIYFIECKNLYGNITVNENGDFIRTYLYNGKQYKKGIYSPLRQVEAQRDVYKKIWNNSLSSNKFFNSVRRAIAGPHFEEYRKVLVVAANHDTILNTRFAPKNVRNKVIRSDALVSRIKQDLDSSDKMAWSSQKDMEEVAKFFMSINVDKDNNYYEYYKNKFMVESIVNIDEENLREKLIEFRKQRSTEMNIPAYYVFNNEELDKIIEYKPNNLEGLIPILTEIKVKTHGKKIIELLNSIY